MFVGLTGMGGGAVMTPFLISVVGIGPVVAVGTDLIYSAATKIVGAWLHTRQGTVDFALVKRLAMGSVPAGLAAVAAIRFLPAAGVDADQAVKRALGAVLILVAIVMLCRLFVAQNRNLPERWRAALEGRGTIVAGIVVGALVGFTSVGSGALLVPFLICVYPLSPAQSSARSSSERGNLGGNGRRTLSRWRTLPTARKPWNATICHWSSFRDHAWRMRAGDSPASP